MKIKGSRANLSIQTWRRLAEKQAYVNFQTYNIIIMCRTHVYALPYTHAHDKHNIIMNKRYFKIMEIFAL